MNIKKLEFYSTISAFASQYSDSLSRNLTLVDGIIHSWLMCVTTYKLYRLATISLGFNDSPLLIVNQVLNVSMILYF